MAGRLRHVMRRFWRVLLPIAVFTFSALVMAAWLGVRAFEARNHLNEARRELLALESGLRLGRLQTGDSGVAQAVAAAARRTQAARRVTSDGFWQFASRVPIAGCPMQASAQLVGSADALTREVVQPLAALGPVLTPRRNATGFAADVVALRRARNDIASLADRARALKAAVAKTQSCGPPGEVLGLDSARAELSTRVERIAAASVDLEMASRLLPSMLGADGLRRYLLVVQNDAESRATGGVIGGYGLLTASKGRLSLDTRNAGTMPSFGVGPVLRLSREQENRYGRLGLAKYWGNANLTPDYPLAARTFSSMWSRGTGQQLDGVVAIDPVLLGYLVSEVGSARMPDGRRVSGRDLVPLLQSRIYAMLPTDEQRDAYFAGVGKAIYSAILTSAASPMRLLSALGRSTDEGRLLIWSRRAAEQRVLEGTPLAGVLPAARGPFLAVVSQNGTGSKLDYWLRRSTEYRLRRLPSGAGEAVVTVRLTNTAPKKGLPLYVRQRLEETAPRNLTPGQSALYVSIYGGVGAGFTAATLDGQTVALESQTEKGHGVFSTFVSINPGQTNVLRVVLSEPEWRSYVTVRRQPLIHAETMTVVGARSVRPGITPFR